MIGAVMCGGLGTRVRSADLASCEKPLLELEGIAMVDRVLAAMKSSGRFERLVAIVSPNTPATRRHVESIGQEYFETAGKGYSRDLAEFLRTCRDQLVMVVPADICLLDGKLVDSLVSRLSEKKSPATSAVCSLDYVQKLGLTPSVILKRFEDGEENTCCHSGITLFDTSLIPAEVGKMIGETYVLIDEVGVAVNVNTIAELDLAGRLLVERPENLAENESL
ncbi:MAG: NTP transferase domain-containing protein [Nitrososphaera sp.]